MSDASTPPDGTSQAPPEATAAARVPYGKPAPREAPKPPAVSPYGKPVAKPAAAPAAPPAETAPVDDPKPAAKPQTSTPRQAAAREKVIAKLEERASRAEDYGKRLDVYAKRELAGLNEQTRKYVAKIAGSDPARVLDAIEGLREGGLLRAGAQPAAKPANTEPAERAVTKPAASAEVDPDAAALREHERLKGVAPGRAAAFLLQNHASIERARSRASRN